MSTTMVNQKLIRPHAFRPISSIEKLIKLENKRKHAETKANL